MRSRISQIGRSLGRRIDARAKGLIARLAVAGLIAATGCIDQGSAAPVGSMASVQADPVAPTVILISLDGTRPADLRAGRLPSLTALGEAGLYGSLIPVNPSNTFPNHVSLATGVRPDVHRLVNNTFVDPERGRFKRDAPEAWIEAEPIWSVAERFGVPTASFYWVGSEGPWSAGPGPSSWKRFSSRTSERTKVDQILAWLDVPDAARRPRLVTAWFHGADHEGHVGGPDSPGVSKTLRLQDRQIARLVEGLEVRGRFASTTLIFVSDHGMATARRRVDLGRALREAGIRSRTLGIGGFSSVYLSTDQPTREELDQTVAVAREEGLEAYARRRAPNDWHVEDVRFGDVVVRAPLGTAIVTPTTLIEGFHGYDPALPEMAGLLVARGRGIRAGGEVGRVSNLSVAPTVLALLGLPVPPQMAAPPLEAMLIGVAARAAEPMTSRSSTERDARRGHVGEG